MDKLIKILEENHALLSKIVINEESTEISSALPKTLLDLVNQMNKQKENPSENPEKEEENEDDKTKSDSKLETIVEESGMLFSIINPLNNKITCRITNVQFPIE